MSMAIDEVLSRMHDTAVEYYQGGNKSKNVYELLMLFHRDIEKAVKIEPVAKSAITTPTCEKSSQVGDMAAMREALSDACYAMFNFLKAQNGGYEEMAKALDKAKSTLAKPPRNCDLFGGDPKKLHELWWEWSGDLKNCNADGTVKFTFGEWLLMPAEAKGGEK